MKRILIFALTLALLLSCVPIVTLAQTYTPDGAISNASEFENMNPNGTYYLTGNIDFSEKSAYPNYILENFSGTLDGRGYALTGIKFDNSNYSATCGVFAKVGVDADTVIKNLSIGTSTAKIPVSIWAHGTPAIAGVVAGQHISDTYTVQIDNVHVYADFSQLLAKSNVYMGGIIGHSSGTVISNCTVNGTISGDGRATNETSVGGIVGISYGATITNCINNASISVKQNNTQIRCGGIVGMAKKNTYVRKCVNFGNISIPGMEGRNLSNGYLGGLIGISQCTAENGSVTDCASFGNITVEVHTNGATAAYLYAGIVGSDATGSVYKNCINYGTLTNENATGTKGGVCASKATASSFTGCFDATATPEANANTDTAGVQSTPAVSGSYNIRAVASVNSLDYVNVGFAGVAYWVENGVLKTWSFRYNCRTVYKTILGSVGENLTEYSADDFGGNYLMALTFEGVPQNADVTIKCTSYSETAQGEFVYGTTTNINYAQAACVGVYNMD